LGLVGLGVKGPKKIQKKVDWGGKGWVSKVQWGAKGQKKHRGVEVVKGGDNVSW